jgi:drug/metabolite transporter (DMT)-like permease
MSAPMHLLFPLFSSVVFVIAAMFAKQAGVRGASPYTSTILSNSCLAVIWATVGLWRGELLGPAGWLPAAGIALAFVAGQLCTYLAFQYGDVSLATPIFGVKIIIVAVISSLMAEKAVEGPIWVAAVLAAIGVAVVQAGSTASRGVKRSTGRTALTVMLALSAATALSIFDVGLQIYGKRFGAERFLSTMFVLTGVWSLGLLPGADRPARVRQIGAGGPLAIAGVLMAVQAVSISYSLGRFGDATRINIVYALRGLWSVLLAWVLGRMAASPEGGHSTRTMAFRLAGALLLLAAVMAAMTAGAS